MYLDGILLMRATLEELLMAPDTLIYLLHSLGFLINIQKSLLSLQSLQSHSVGSHLLILLLKYLILFSSFLFPSESFAKP